MPSILSTIASALLFLSILSTVSASRHGARHLPHHARNVIAKQTFGAPDPSGFTVRPRVFKTDPTHLEFAPDLDMRSNDVEVAYNEIMKRKAASTMPTSTKTTSTKSGKV